MFADDRVDGVGGIVWGILSRFLFINLMEVVNSNNNNSFHPAKSENGAKHENCETVMIIKMMLKFSTHQI